MTEPDGGRLGTPRREGFSRLERGLLLAAGAALFLLFRFAPTDLYYADDVSFAETLARRDFVAAHPATGVLGYLIQSLSGCTPERALHSVCAFGAALLVLSTYGILRTLRHGVGLSLSAAAVVLLAPGTLLFGRHIEVKALHAGCVALALGRVLRGGRGWRGSLIDSACLALVPLSHATGWLSLPFLAWLGARRSGAPILRGMFRLGSWAVAFAALGLLAVSFNLGVSRGESLSPRPTPVHVAVDEALVLLKTIDLGRFLAYPFVALLVPSGAVAVLGIPGIFLSRGPLRFPLLSWVAVTTLFFSAWGYVVRGGHLLALYPVLAIGLADLLSLTSGLRGRRAWVPRLGTFALVFCQALWGIRHGIVGTMGPDPFAWLRAAREEIGETGWLVSGKAPHVVLARRYTRLQVASLFHLLLFEEKDVPRLGEAVREVIERETREGMPVYIDLDLAPEAAAKPIVSKFFADLGDRLERVPVSRGPFRAWRVVGTRGRENPR